MKNNSNKYYETIAKAIQYLVGHREQQPTLADLSNHIGLSEYHLQRIFSEWVGVSPKQFLQYLTKEYAKEKLKHESVMETTLLTGLSSSSRLHDLMITCEGMTPGEIKNLGKGLTISYGVYNSPFGMCFIANTHRGICRLAFFDFDAEQHWLTEDLHQQWAHATIIEDQPKIELLAHNIFNRKKSNKQLLHLLLKGTAFQLKVWEALLSIPAGELVSYQAVAKSIKSAKAVRAAATAIANNTIAYLIPCHRVIRQNGDFGQYRWNKYRKQILIGWEACK